MILPPCCTPALNVALPLRRSLLYVLLVYLSHSLPPSLPLSLSLRLSFAPVSRLLSESFKVKQSETLSAWRTFNNATKARIRGCLLCHAIAKGDGTRWRRKKGTGHGSTEDFNGERNVCQGRK